MSRRASLPGADELFRPTTAPSPAERDEKPRPVQGPVQAFPQAEAPEGGRDTVAAGVKKPKHEEKVTFYCRPEDVTRLDRARLALRSDHLLPSDRGRIVRAALAEILEDFEAQGANSSLVRRLQSGP